MERRKRVTFSDEERVRLTELIEVYRPVIENKKCDNATILEKNKAWDEVTQQMNYLGKSRYPLDFNVEKLLKKRGGDFIRQSVEFMRSTAQLKKLWDNTKYKMKVQAGTTGGNREPARSDEEVSYDMPNHPDMDSVRFQDVTEAMDHRLNIYQVPEVKTEEEKTWEIQQNDQPELQENEPEHYSRSEEYKREQDHLHNLKLKEAQMKVTLLEKQMQYDEELFQLRKKKLLLEILRLEKEIQK